jgi:hypothetical protein
MPSPSSRTEPDRRPRGADAPIVWSGGAVNGWMPLVIVIVLGQAAVVSLLLGKMPGLVPYVNAAHVIILGAFTLFAKIRVQVDARQLVIRYGYLGWPRQRLALARVSAARAVELAPLDHGGWGYRGSLRFFGRAAVVVRGGDALELDVDGGKRLSITLDDAESAARRINALVSGRLDTVDGSR